MRQKLAELLDLKEAMNNLATLASINMESPPPLGIVEDRRFVIETEDFGKAKVAWLSGEGADEVLRLLDRCYRSVLYHLETLYDSSEMDWTSKKSKEGIASMMAIVGESAQKIDQYLAYRLDEEIKSEQSDVFKSLQKFYSERFSKRFALDIEGKEAWRQEWQEKKASTHLVGNELIDFEEIVRDREYELFFLKNEKGDPFFDRKCLQNVKLTAEFDVESTPFEGDPFLKVRTMLDRDLNATSQQILKLCAHEIEDFYKDYRMMEPTDLSKNLSQCLLALFMAANPRHLRTSTSRKNCSRYFHDFHYFLRLALKSNAYQKWIVYPPETENRHFDILTTLVHKLCFAIFERMGGVKQEAIGLIHRIARRGGEIQNQKIKEMKGETLWNELLLDDEKLRTWLSKYPNGPIMKTLELIRQEDELEKQVPFDPLFQDNLPIHLFDIQKKKMKVQVFRIPCPTRQFTLDKAEITDEFRGFLRFIASVEHQKHLMVNFQDRLAWKESARSLSIENLQKVQKFTSHLFVMTLPKDTNFYYQNNEFEELNNASSFFKAFEEILVSCEDHGFYFPPQWKKDLVVQFAKDAFPQIHRYFLNNKNVLTRKERCDAIELFYQLLILKALELTQAQTLSFTCKDALDTSAAEAACFYGFLSILAGDLKTKEETDFLRYLLYFPALFIRERAVDAERLHAALSLLECVDSAFSDYKDKLKKALSIDWDVYPKKK